jgi:hypothetical protein
MMQYTYEPLALPTETTKPVRLLTILPGVQYSLIRCKLEFAELNSSKSYETLSYA